LGTDLYQGTPHETEIYGFFRTFGALSKPLRSANPLSIRE
jgi:hypothetical protein